MVEKNVAYNRGSRSEEFADNDPLAELARIVGFEDRPSHVTSQATQSVASPAVRREPEFNLEDELLREFEVYDAPDTEPVVLDPANDVRGGIHAGDFMQRVESVFARREPDFAPAAEPQVREEPLPGAEFAYTPQVEGAQPFDIRDDFRDDASVVAEVFDVQPRQPQPVAYQEAAYEQPQWQPEPSFEPQQAEWHEMPELPADVSSSQQHYAHADVAQSSAFDLADEVEQAVAAEAPAAPAPVAPTVRAPSHVGRSSLEFSGLRLPLANFGARRDVPAAEPRWVEARVEPTPTAVQAQDVAPSFAPVAASAATDQLSPMDELIYDVAKYSIPTRETETSVAREPVVSAPVREEPVMAEVPVGDAPAAELEGFNDDDFQLALDDLDLDLDLSEISSIDVVSEPVAAAPVVAAPVVAAQPRPAPVVAPIPVRVAPAASTRPATVTVAAAPAAAASAPVAVAPAPPAPRPAAPVAAAPAPQAAAPESLESLPFDPSQIGETEEHPETITEMDVPELPVAVFEPKPVRRHEEDLDIDTELAALFAPAVTGGLDRHKNAEMRGPAAQARAPIQPPQDVDEFERALEEDFRRSMQEAATSRGSQSRDNGSGYVDHQAAYRGEEERSGRRWLMPAAAALGLVLVGGGVYALMFGGSSSQGSGGAPVIISADSDPMKVVPENPGGRVVPNQDKAVYDRVAGGSAADPKQPSLISSNEEPVDVVQRTLIPEQLPLENEDDADMAAAGTPVGETEDPRLLSPEEKAAQSETTATPGVSPRKVRTMIVKPDGTLVAQEVDAPAAQPAQTAKVEELAAPQAATPGEGVPAVIAASRVPVTPEPAQNHTPAAPATTAPPAASPSAAPLPAARPSAQPATVVATVTDQGNVRPTAPAQPQATQQTAAATPAATSTPSSGGYYVQVASLPSQAEAQKSYQSLSAKFGSVIGGRGVDIKAAEIAGKGTFYRVRIPAGDKNEAVALCERYRAAGGSCLVAR